MENKKKLLYIVRYPLGQPFNLKAKFDGQLCAFKNLGFDVSYLAFDETNFYLVSDGQQIAVGKAHSRFPSYLHTLCYSDLYAAALRVVKSEFFDYIYWRSSPHFASSHRLAKFISRTKSKLIYEYPTFPINREKPGSLLRAVYMPYSSHLQNKIDRLVDGFVLMGEEAGGTYRGKPAVNISNGVNLDVVPARNRKLSPEAIHILALASMSYWHGYDRLIRSLAEYSGEQNVIIHMVGGNDGGALPEWMELTRKLGLEDKVIFHGPKNGRDLDEIFDLCDIGVNSLGRYRTGLTVTAELKTREYAARGLPFICSVGDPVLLLAEEPMWMQVPNDDSIPDMEEIVAFALRMRDKENAVESLRAFAKEHLSWESQYEKVFRELQ